MRVAKPLVLLALTSLFGCKTASEGGTASVKSPPSETDGTPPTSEQSATQDGSSRYWRGNPWNYDPGPRPGSKWTELFSATPNYRAIGIDLLKGSANDEKFRWVYGPMYYRGRLEPDSVKVFVIGQEGAQDENLSNHSFTGSTGTKMQNFLRTIGINHDYLFMNTFVYTINGQYDSASQDVQRLSQHLKSPLVVQRHALFDYMWETNKNKLNLIVGVGSAGKDTAVTWIRHRWMATGLTADAAMKKCKNLDGASGWQSCDLSVLGNVRAVGLPHPGGASPANGGESALQNIVTKFSAAIKQIQAWLQADPNWLPADPNPAQGGQPLARDFGNYQYGNTSVPFHDFPYGIAWRLGAWGTSSNRRTARAIQIFSANGKYNGEGDNPQYAPAEMPDRGAKIAEMQAEDRAWEPPRSPSARDAFDAGPGKFAAVLMGGESGGWPKFEGAISHPSFGHGPIYRGRLERARVLVLGDQESQDDLFSGRALTGEGGQKLQAFLASAGITDSYAVLRTLPVDTIGTPDAQILGLATDPQVEKVRQDIVNKVLGENQTQVILAVGKVAGQVVDRLQVQGKTVIKMAGGKDEGFKASWDQALAQLKSMDLKGDEAATWAYDGGLKDLPRKDMPFHMRWWMGTGGDRAVRATKAGKISGDYYQVWTPKWISKIPVPALSSTEKQALAAVKGQAMQVAPPAEADVPASDADGAADLPQFTTIPDQVQ